MTFILQQGALIIGTKRSQGRLLITDKHIFALAENSSAAMSLGMVGGVLGALLGSAIDKFGNRSKTPDFLNDPDLDAIPESTKRLLRGTELRRKLSFASGVTVRSSFAGYSFQDADGPLTFNVGLLFKGKIRKKLEQLNVPISNAPKSD